MPVAALILVEPSRAGNLGAVLRVAANFGVRRVDLVRSAIDVDDPEVAAWACGAVRRLEVGSWDRLADAAATHRTLVASASGRGRERQPVVTPHEAVREIGRRGAPSTALLFGNETRGLSSHDLDRCDFVVRVPTVPEFPVLNLAQAVAVVLSYLAMELEPDAECGPLPAPNHEVDALVRHLEQSLLAIGFLDPAAPDRILRKLHRLFGRACITANEVAILRGVCRQMLWAARTSPRSTKPER